MKKIFLTTFVFLQLAINVNAMEVYSPGFNIYGSPLESFTSQKRWIFFNKKNQSFVIQAYLPDFKKENVDFKVEERLTGGLRVRIIASQWRDVPATADGLLPKRVLMTFDESISLPVEIDSEFITSRFDGEILTVIIPKKGSVGGIKVSF